jgi:hypothetical protein
MVHQQKSIGDPVPPEETPDKAKPKGRPERPTTQPPRVEIEAVPASLLEDEEFLRAAPVAIADYGTAVLRGIFGARYEEAPTLSGFQSVLAPQSLLWSRATGRENGQLVSGTPLEAAKDVVQSAAEAKRAVVCVLSLSLGIAGKARKLTNEEQGFRKVAHHSAAALASAWKSRAQAQTDALSNVLEFLGNPKLRPECQFVSDLGLVGHVQAKQVRALDSGQRWFKVSASEAVALTEGVQRLSKGPGFEFHLLLTSLPKRWESWPVGGDTHGDRLHAALDRALTGVSMPAVEKPLEEMAGPTDGVAIARAVWQSLRTEMKGVIEERIRELSQQTFETYEEKAAVAAELHQAMLDWGFRAISPQTGRASYLRCHRQDRVNPNGCFQFRDIAGADVVAAPDADAPMTSVRLAFFRLTDAPPDKRLSAKT